MSDNPSAAYSPELSSEGGTESVDNEDGPQDISPENDGKLMKRVVRKGDGWTTPVEGDEVNVHYIGKLLDGTVFDSSRDRNEKFSFCVGRGQVIKGWDIAVKSMKCGEISVFTIAAELAYGSQGAPPKIPADATLEFEIELFDWRLQDITKQKDGSVCKRILMPGEGYSTPNEDAICDIHIVGKYGDNVFDERELTLICGEFADANVVEGVDIAVQKMKKGESCEVFIKPKYAFGVKAMPEYNIPENYDQIVYEITLKKFENAKQVYEMNDNEKLENAENAKSKGTHYFNESKFEFAIKQYKRITKLLQSLEDSKNEENKAKQQQLLLAAHLNLAISYIKVNEHSDALKSCNSALEIDGDNTKALFRRGLAYYGLKDYNFAKNEFNAVLKLEPNNKAARNQLLTAEKAIRADIDREKELCKKMFLSIGREEKRKDENSTAAKKDECCADDADKKDETLENIHLIESDAKA